MKEIKYKLDALEEMLKEDGYNGSNIVMQTLNELREQFKNCNLQNVSNNEVAVCCDPNLDNPEDCKVEHCCYVCTQFRKQTDC